MQPPTILITGASGLLGQACLRELLPRYSPGTVAALVRRGRDTSLLQRLGILPVEVDLTQPQLGLSPMTYRHLADGARAIIHAAADIRFHVSLDESRRTNLIGTQNLLRFARDCPHLQKFAHISTVYVAGGRPGLLPEEPVQPGPFFNPYQKSKFEAEQAVLATMADLPAAIYRFSTMIYNASLGRVEQFNYFHQLLRLAQGNPLPQLPADPNSRIDLIPSDWAGHAFNHLFDQHWNRGAVVHICAGAKQSLTVGELMQICFKRLPLSGAAPELVNLQHFNQNSGLILNTPSRRSMWQKLGLFLPHLNINQSFACEKLDAAIKGHTNLQRPDPRSLVSAVLEYCLEAKWGARQQDSELQPA